MLASLTMNGATAASKGVELQLQALLPKGWAVLSSYGYANARLTQDVPGLVTDASGSHTAFSGDRLPGSPQHTGSLVLQYSRPLPKDYSLRADYGITYTGDVYTKAGLRASGEKLGGYALHEASVGLEKGRWQVSLYGENLFNKYAYTATTADRSYLGVVGDFTTRRYQHWIIRPRQVGLELSARF